MDPIAIALGVSSLAGFIGSIFGSSKGASSSKEIAEMQAKSQRETNAANAAMVQDTNNMNYRIQQETNAANFHLAEMQNEWNLQQWNRENAYNSPANQVDLYRAAGLNPALVGGQFSPAQHLESAPMANQQSMTMQAPQYENPEKYAMTARLEGARQISDMYKNLTKDTLSTIKNVKEIRKLDADTNNSTLLTKSELQKNEKLLNYYDANIHRIESLTPVERQYLYNKIDETEAHYSMLLAQTDNEKKRGFLLEKQSSLMELQCKLADFDLNQTKPAMLRLVAAQARAAAAKGRIDEWYADFVEKNNHQPYNSPLANVLGIFSGWLTRHANADQIDEFFKGLARVASDDSYTMRMFMKDFATKFGISFEDDGTQKNYKPRENYKVGYQDLPPIG